MHYDSLQNPVQPNHKRAQTIVNQAHNWLQEHPYEEFTEEELENVMCLIRRLRVRICDLTNDFILQAKKLLKDEMSVVKEGMAHGELSLESYTTVWEECLSQVCKSITFWIVTSLTYLSVCFLGFISGATEEVYQSDSGLQEGQNRGVREKIGGESNAHDGRSETSREDGEEIEGFVRRLSGRLYFTKRNTKKNL